MTPLDSTMRAAGRSVGAAILMVAAALPLHAGDEHPVEIARIDLPAELGRPLPENTLKLFRAAVDSVSRRLFVAGILTPHLAVLDLDTGRWVGSIDSELARGYKYLDTDEMSHLLFIRDGSNGSLSRVNPEPGTVDARIQVPARSGALLCDGERGLVYLLTPEPPSFRAYREETLELAWSSAEMGTGINSLVPDPETGELLVLDGGQRGPRGRIYRFDPGSRSITGTLTFELPPGARAGRVFLDSVGRRIVVTVGSREIRTLAMDGSAIASYRVPAELDLQSVALDADRSRLLLVAVEHPKGEAVAGVGGHLLVVDLETMDLVREMTFGRKLRSIAVDAATGTAYLPNGDASTVWKVDPGEGRVVALRLGDSAEQVLPVDGGRRLILNSRLGGSYLMAWAVQSRRLETLEAGTWPIPMRYLDDGDLLVVLNAWDGTLSIFHSRELDEAPATLPLDLPAGTTDRLPDLAVDAGRRLAFAAYPEHAAIAMADLEVFSPAGVLEVPGAVAGDTGGGPGQLLLGVDSRADRLLAVEPARGRVIVFSIDERRVVDAARFSPAKTGPVAADMVWVDEQRHTCWVGRVELSTADGSPTGRTLPRGDRIFAADGARDVYWVAGTESRAGESVDILIALETGSLRETGAWTLGPADAVHSSFAFVPPDRIYRARMTVVDLTAWAILPTSPRPIDTVPRVLPRPE
ncbi:MAG: hypothetical protein GXP47_09765 [Acidobacteria bacterium]|nr:hypothetical protein [Acidobacteriota bacterium]